MRASCLGDGAEFEILPACLRLVAVTVEARAVGAGAAKIDELGAQLGASAVQCDARVVRRDAERARGRGDGFALQLDPSQQIGVRGLERGQQAFEATADLVFRFAVGHGEGARVARPRVVAFSRSATRSRVIDDGATENLIKPGDAFFAVLQFASSLDGLDETILEHVLGVGCVAEACGDERFEVVAVAEQRGRDVGRSRIRHGNDLNRIGLQDKRRAGGVDGAGCDFAGAYLQQARVVHVFESCVIVFLTALLSVTIVPVQREHSCFVLVRDAPGAPFPAGPRSRCVHVVVVLQPGQAVALELARGVAVVDVGGELRFQYCGPGPAKLAGAARPDNMMTTSETAPAIVVEEGDAFM